MRKADTATSPFCTQVYWVFAIAAVLSLASACKSYSFGPIVSPCVGGQVLAAGTLAPLEGVKVMRVMDRVNRSMPPKEGEKLTQKNPSLTDSDGRFVLQSERVLSLLGGTGRDKVKVRFEKPGYITLVTNVPLSTATNTTQPDEPFADAGMVFLKPVHH